MIEPKLAFFQEQEKVFWNAVIFSKHKFSLVPKDVDAVDMAFLFNKCFRMIDPDVVELPDIQHIVGEVAREN